MISFRCEMPSIQRCPRAILMKGDTSWREYAGCVSRTHLVSLFLYKTPPPPPQTYPLNTLTLPHLANFDESFPMSRVHLARALVLTCPF